MKRLVMVTAAALMALALGTLAVAETRESDNSMTDWTYRWPSWERTRMIGTVNINRADVEQLALVPGLDRKTAENIVAFRSVNGPFDSVEELFRIRGFSMDSLEVAQRHLRNEGETDLRPAPVYPYPRFKVPF